MWGELGWLDGYVEKPGLLSCKASMKAHTALFLALVWLPYLPSIYYEHIITHNTSTQNRNWFGLFAQSNVVCIDYSL